jgi:hypothetical protein
MSLVGAQLLFEGTFCAIYAGRNVAGKRALQVISRLDNNVQIATEVPVEDAEILAENFQAAARAIHGGKPEMPMTLDRSSERLQIEFSLCASGGGNLQQKDAIFHLGDGAGGEFHLDQWRQAIAQTNAKFLIVVRSLDVFNALRAKENADVAFVKDGRAVEGLFSVCPNVKAVFYSSNTGNVIHFLRIPNLTHIFLGHGDSEKGASCHKFFRVYDEIWTAGAAHVDRFVNSGIAFAGLKFKIIGRPALAPELDGPTDHTGRFLYLPTWEGFFSDQNFSSIAISRDMAIQVAKLTGDLPVIKLHPFSGKQDKSGLYSEAEFASRFRSEKVSAEIVPRTETAISQMSATDFLIADISSVVTDYLVFKRPIFLYMPDNVSLGAAISNMRFESYCYVFKTVDELMGLVKRVILEKRDFLAESRVNALSYFIDVEKTRANAFAREIDRILGSASCG